MTNKITEPNSPYFEKSDLAKMAIDQRHCHHEFESKTTVSGLLPYKICRKCKVIELNNQIFYFNEGDS